MHEFRLALLASCVACPALAQTGPTVPALVNRQVAVASASAQASGQVSAANAQAGAVNAQIEARMRAQQAAAGGGQGTVPATMPPPVDPISPNKPLTRKEVVGVTVASRWVNQFRKPH